MSNNFKSFINGIRIKSSLSSDPISGKLGELYFNITNNQVMVCTNESPVKWMAINLLEGNVDNAIVTWDDINKKYVLENSVLCSPNTLSSTGNLNIQSASTLHLMGNNINFDINGNNINMPTSLGNNGDSLTLNGNDLNWSTIVGRAVVDDINSTYSVLPTDATSPIGNLFPFNGMKIIFTNLITNPNFIYIGTISGSVINWMIFNGGQVANSLTPGDMVFVDNGNFKGSVFHYLDNTWKIFDPSSGILAVDLYDPLSTTQTVNAIITIDGVQVTNEMTVLFSNLSNPSTNNKVYKAYVDSGTGFVTNWVVQSVFKGLTTPYDAAQVIIRSGSAFNEQTGRFNGITWLFNTQMRFFNGANYWELSGLLNCTLENNTAIATPIFSVNYPFSENMIVNYSINRGTTKEVGTLNITTDGVNVAISRTNSGIGDTGVDFTADIYSGLLRLKYTSSDTGTNGSIQYYIARWPDMMGGPNGPINYNTGSVPVQAAGNSGNIQFNGGGILSASNYLNFDSVTNDLVLNGLRISPLVSEVILDNQISPIDIMAFPVSLGTHAHIEYSIDRDLPDGSARSGILMITANKQLTSVSIVDDYIEEGFTGVAFYANIVGGNIVISYTSANIGVGGTCKRSIRKWI